ncbi:hypothetical protein, partial [Asaia lannensis]|uniref:hypothetical protein n=1 Tax=Asaia lannensis TaxID=415421 RepID=UPI002232C15F
QLRRVDTSNLGLYSRTDGRHCPFIRQTINVDRYKGENTHRARCMCKGTDLSVSRQQQPSAREERAQMHATGER